MKYKYTITTNFLNSVSEFFRLHGALYAMGENLPFFHELKQIAGTRSALAACAMDEKIEYDSLITNSQIIKIPDNIEDKVKKYLRARSLIGKYFLKDNKLDYNELLEIHSIISGKEGQISNLRKTEKVHPKIVFEYGIYKSIEINIKTEPQEIQTKLAKLVDFIESNKLTMNPVILAALTHYTLVGIHPFDDGNGRTSKIFVHGVLYESKIDAENLIMIEEFYLRNKNRYYEILNKSDEDLTEWLEFFASALHFGANQACKLLSEISGGTVNLNPESGKPRLVYLTENERKVIKLLQKHPDYTGAEIARRIGITRQYINNIFMTLSKKGVVEKSGKGTGTKYKIKG